MNIQTYMSTNLVQKHEQYICSNSYETTINKLVEKNVKQFRKLVS